MARSLIAVVSCHSRENWANAIRETWLPLVPPSTDVRFFVGRGETLVSADVVQLDCGDEYESLPAKVQAIARWALEQGYEFVLKLDDDCVVNPVKMLVSNYVNHDYTGSAGHRPTPTRNYYVPGGYAYWLSARSMQHVVVAQLPADGNDEQWVAGVLAQQGVVLNDDQRYYISVCRGLLRETQGLRRLSNRILREPPAGTFAWCIFMENHYGKRHSEAEKVAEFHRVFVSEVRGK